MAKENLFMKEAREKGLVDDREIALVADVYCTSGDRGRVWFFLNGATLRLYELKGLAGMGAPVESIDLRGAEFIKGSSFFLNSFVKFRVGNDTYIFRNFAQAKRAVEAVKGSCGR